MTTTVLKQDDYKTLVIAGIPFTARPIEPYFGYVGQFDEVAGDYGATSGYDIAEVIDKDINLPGSIVTKSNNGSYDYECAFMKRYVRELLPRGARMSDVSYLTEWKLAPVLVLYKGELVGTVMPVKS